LVFITGISAEAKLQLNRALSLKGIAQSVAPIIISTRQPKRFDFKDETKLGIFGYTTQLYPQTCTIDGAINIPALIFNPSVFR
jgi:hypothetical protein